MRAALEALRTIGLGFAVIGIPAAIIIVAMAYAPELTMVAIVVGVSWIVGTVLRG